MSIINRLAVSLADRYRLERELGAGGMATVYLAHDLKHEREVAIKVLHPDLGAALGSERFLTEIKTTAKLQHPHILPLLDSGAADGLLYYVMPFVRGETLRTRLDREKQLSIPDALRIAREVASALEHAHKQGIIHRDIKPENILLQDGAAVVADFGIALAVQSAGGARMTQTGLSLGTPQYMSPEQAMGERSIDARSDIYALGAVTYEMLAGEPPFSGNSVQAIVARVLTERPTALRTFRDTVSSSVEAAVLQALAKLPADRPESARQFADALAGATATTAASGASLSADVPRVNSTRARTVIALMAAVTTLFALTTVWLWRDRTNTSSVAPRLHATLMLSSNVNDRLIDRPIIAPDGHAVAVIMADSSGTTTLRVRRLDSATAIVLSGTEGASRPFWSPDSRSLAFFVDRTLYRVDASGGKPQRIADVGVPRYNGQWLTDDLVVVSVVETDAYQAISVRDGRKGDFYAGETNTDIVDRVFAVGDGKHAVVRLFSASTDKPYRFDLVEFSEYRAKRVRRLESLTKLSQDRGLIGFIPANGRYAVFGEGELWQGEYDPSTMELSGELRPLVSGIGSGGWDVSPGGHLVFREIPTLAARILLLDRAGATATQVGETAEGPLDAYYGPRYSPDGGSVAYEWHNGANRGDLWRMDLSTMRPIRQTRDETHHNAFVAWSPDGRQLVFESTRDGNDLFVRDADGSTDRRIPLRMETGFPSDWSPDGRTILFGDKANGGDVYATTPRGDSLRKVLSSDATEMQAVFSPDGRWIAYASDEQNRRFEVFMRRWPITDEKWLVSTAGGTSPRWRGDGKELYFQRQDVASSTKLFAVDVNLRSSAPVIGAERLLFERSFASLGLNLRSAVNYDVRKDGQQFVAVVVDDAPRATAPSVELLLNWQQSGKPERPR